MPSDQYGYIREQIGLATKRLRAPHQDENEAFSDAFRNCLHMFKEIVFKRIEIAEPNAIRCLRVIQNGIHFGVLTASNGESAGYQKSKSMSFDQKKVFADAVWEINNFFETLE
ncbi:hypothetical protein KIH39_08510 [Telmatocola sphagniphila]|uniref:Uncharacterized protein n=1 Tax=Telmatocola sphagniphila TaxID=1123043 RepID=A0A8E6EUP4_9BACT|nr:hypothetical protein [Telmatocola sphagniphila]QVL33934.1 hypothetical protein KIH39_08510 [Telmatocola sphagniphila]